MERYVSLPYEDDFEDFLNENKELYYNACYKQIHENFYGENLDEVEIMVVLFEDNPDTEYVISVIREEYELNLSYCLAYFEDEEDYEMCQKINELISNIRVYNELNPNKDES